MDHAVTTFLRNRGQILLVRRPSAVDVYPNRWSGIADYLQSEPDDPLAEAERHLRETIGSGRVDLVRSGAPITVPDEDRTWLVHPFLFDVETRQIPSDGSIEGAEWVHSTAIRDRDTVPMLWETYRRVAPTVETIRTDEVHGASWLSVRALEVLRDEAASVDEWDGVVGLARELVDVRPGMVTIGNRVNRVMADVVDGVNLVDGDDAVADAPSPAFVHDRSIGAIDRAVEADGTAARSVAELLESGNRFRRRGGPIVTLSRSETVVDALLELCSRTEPAGRSESADRSEPPADIRVLVGESRPDREGVGVAETLSDSGIEVMLAADSALPWLLECGDAGCVLVGADTVDPSGGVYNKAGTYGLALAADRAGVPVVVVASSSKIAPTAGFEQERSDPAAVYGGSSGIEVATPRFDRTPPGLVTAIVTEHGTLSTADVRSIAAEHRTNAAWSRRAVGTDDV
ncbi:Translation initiation factor 2B subunit, eIF-2Balpha/beta/delta family [Halalkaliarchaeum sp. AArc-CO]|uniref:NUDIX domain-containing protein n=1 Tax=unclassified Halalkaliarchaeum TaxID=2678344 RepID=UPI00217D7183|nr:MULTISPECIES: NUDIX domain-containing protein [unclassified Halalkaliarchaeum]MDR5672247.1 translation initiation factor 2 [Halalkaliarchaeum sp. AArc-GB]UWG50137.1 Translation initiation factor 2B subunit, eIF-2Balpha/beta/delta family [Halalkaliarchaeum sp. AArc-CO]